MIIFVFGSNLAGRHGAGAALHARQHHGAIYGQGIGLQGQSYGIPTKSADLKTLALEEISKHVADFFEHARKNPHNHYMVTQIGCGLAGYRPTQIAPLFDEAPPNVYLSGAWIRAIMCE